MAALTPCSVHAAIIHGIEAVPVVVEVSSAGGLQGINIVGRPSPAVLESRARIRAAFKDCGFEMPRVPITVNLVPADLRKDGTGFDLAIAAAILGASGQIPRDFLDGLLLVGELGLRGDVYPVRGEVAYERLAHQQGLQLVTGCDDGQSTGSSLRVENLSRLRQGPDGLAVGHRGNATGGRLVSGHSQALDFRDVVDQEIPKRAVVIAAAGGHGMLMMGPPGAGKSMIAKRLPTILPPLDEDERKAAMLVHSVAGEPLESLAAGVRPFRAPHHSISTAGLVGGGRPVLPGEISLAHRGVLFLDELPEFGARALQSLRQPLEDHEVRIVRVDGVFAFPADFLLVAAANPCPCGHLGDPGHECRCTPAMIDGYLGRIGGPLMDRIDLQVDVARPKSREVVDGHGGTDSASMREAVLAAREFRDWRVARRGIPRRDGEVSRELCEEARDALVDVASRLAMGGRAIVRTSRVARTIADIAGHDLVGVDDVMEALGYRNRTVA